MGRSVGAQEPEPAPPVEELPGGMPLDRSPGRAETPRVTPLIGSQAAELLARIKARNREAIRQVNRQKRLDRCDINVVLIVLDDVGYGDLGCYGQRHTETPRIDQLAAEGVRFTQFYAGSATGVPSRGCLLSGNDTRVGRKVGDDWVTLRVPDFSLAEVMYEAGYTTGLVGKWGVGDLEEAGEPNEQGFQHAFGYLDRAHAENHFPDHLWRNATRVPYPGNEGGRKEQYSADLVTEEAKEFLRRAADLRRPFFLMGHYSIAHANLAQFRAGGDGLEVPSEAPYADTDWTTPQKRRAAMLTRVDGQIGEIVDLLEERGLLHKTLILVTSDNGASPDGGADLAFFESNGPLKGTKNSLEEGGIRVPLIIRPPGLRYAPQRDPDGVPQGAVSDQVWAAWDLLPTLADYVGAWRVPRGIIGQTRRSLLHGGEGEGPEYLYWELHREVTHQAVRMGDWKGIRRGPAASWELYDLAADLAESRDLAAAHPEIIRRIEEIVTRIENERN